MSNENEAQKDQRSLRNEALIFAKELAPRIDPMVGPFDPLVFGYEAGVLAERTRNANAILLEATAQEQDEISVHLLDSNMELLNENNSLLTEKETLEATVARLAAPVTDEEALEVCDTFFDKDDDIEGRVQMQTALMLFLDRRKAGVTPQ